MMLVGLTLGCNLTTITASGGEPPTPVVYYLVDPDGSFILDPDGNKIIAVPPSA